MPTEIGRRDLLRGAGAVTALSYSRVLGANDKIQLGVIGCGERGRDDMSQFQKNPVVDVTAVCDIYGVQIDKARQKAPNARNFSDHRKLLDMKEVDAVLIATPDHWHAPIAIDALNAGKDVYVEKPLTLKIEEGPPIVKAARVNERICQVGMQQRSGKHYLQASASTSIPASSARSRWRAPGGTATRIICGTHRSRCSRSRRTSIGRAIWVR